jgi:hypothetical protein
VKAAVVEDVPVVEVDGQAAVAVAAALVAAEEAEVGQAAVVDVEAEEVGAVAAVAEIAATVAVIEAAVVGAAGS